jgi:hypothetical protein
MQATMKCPRKCSRLPKLPASPSWRDVWRLPLWAEKQAHGCRTWASGPAPVVRSGTGILPVRGHRLAARATNWGLGRKPSLPGLDFQPGQRGTLPRPTASRRSLTVPLSSPYLHRRKPPPIPARQPGTVSFPSASLFPGRDAFHPRPQSPALLLPNAGPQSAPLPSCVPARPFVVAWLSPPLSQRIRDAGGTRPYHGSKHFSAPKPLPTHPILPWHL